MGPKMRANSTKRKRKKWLKKPKEKGFFGNFWRQKKTNKNLPNHFSTFSLSRTLHSIFILMKFFIVEKNSSNERISLFFGNWYHDSKPTISLFTCFKKLYSQFFLCLTFKPCKAFLKILLRTT